jgi:hypothetical protein
MLILLLLQVVVEVDQEHEVGQLAQELIDQALAEEQEVLSTLPIL